MNQLTNKGFFTSEFYLGLFSVVFTYLNNYFNWHVPPDQILSIAGIVITYIISRTVLKVKNPPPTQQQTTPITNSQPTPPSPDPPQNA